MELEKEEVNMLDALKNKALSDYFLKFWGLPASLTIHEVASFLLLFPYANVINGNIPLMRACLKVLLKEDVDIIRKSPLPTIADVESDGGLAKSRWVTI
ncbi:hypothetical protein [Niabella ginsengisoli]|uniref:Uncharacterized protein n=1 Tax=Niabella ginsengisoli TaxID=522298 RepID=A0ABS9SLF5_9BACT|nr:hypothetical protein [Niabella ginsengisoli]MCH5599219.1 hypothetical protein [Niabella ginsengisoli]